MTARFSTPKQQQAMKMMAMVFVPVGFIFTSFLPASVQFYFCIAGASGLVQTGLIFNPTFRRIIGLTALPPPVDPPETSAEEGKSFLEGMKKQFNDAKESVGQKMGEESKKKEGKTSVSDEEKMQLEYYESLRERMAELEKKMKRRP